MYRGYKRYIERFRIRVLGPLEREVISALKDHGEATTRDVLLELRRRGKEVAYTTVCTILTRLHAKGLIERRSEAFKGGERYVYRYKDIEGEYIDSLLGSLMSAFGDRGVAHLAERLDGLSKDDVQRLRERLKT